jgi:hypothetical protein
MVAMVAAAKPRARVNDRTAYRIELRTPDIQVPRVDDSRIKRARLSRGSEARQAERYAAG